MNNKKLFFLVSTPRSGNVVLSSILNQNSELIVTANSIVFEILHRLHELKKDNIFKNFPDHTSLNNVANNVFNNYYQNWKQDIIIDRSPTALTPDNLRYYEYRNYKFIILQRNVEDIVKSFLRIHQKNGDKRSVIEICEEILDPNYLLSRSILSIINGTKGLSKEQYIKIDYEEIINDPKETINKIYNFLDIDKFQHYYTNIDQFNINGLYYQDEVMPYFNGMHEIRLDKISKKEYNLVLPEKILIKCQYLNNLLYS